jgi:penicillin-binding protein 1A
MARLLNPAYRRYRIWAVSLLVFILAGMGTLFTLLYYSLPDLQPVLIKNYYQPTTVFSGDNQVLGVFKEPYNRKYLTVDQLPDTVRKVLVAIEDPHFYAHVGVRASGKSTITIRLARQLMQAQQLKPWPMLNKLRDVFVALYLERQLTKDEILTHYLNFASFGGTVYGIHQAATQYFGHPATELTIPQMALLIGMLKAPTTYNPRRAPDAAIARRNQVCVELAKKGLLAGMTVEEAQAYPLDLAPPKLPAPDTALAPYFVDHVKQWLNKWCKENGKDLHRDGLKVYTTLNTRIQGHAEAAMAKHLAVHQKRMDDFIRYAPILSEKSDLLKRYLVTTPHYQQLKRKGLDEETIRDSLKKKKPMRLFSWETGNYEDLVISPLDSLRRELRTLHCGMVSLDPLNGHVLAWVGGIQHHYYQYDHVAQGRRQVGSAFKPVVFATAFDKGKLPCDRYLNQPVQIPTPEGDMWEPKNADHDYCGEVSLRYGLVHSINVVTARLIQDISPESVVDLSRKMGIRSPLKPVPAMGLGTFDCTVQEMASAYSVFPALGKRAEPLFITRIEDRKGRIIASFQSEKQKVLRPETAYLMVELLRAVALSGTAGNLRWEAGLPYNIDVAGKTGTTQNSSDGWFVGFTPQLVTSIWVGCNDRSINFGHNNYGRGSHMAMPIFSHYYKKVYDDDSLNYYVNSTVPKPPTYAMQILCPYDPIKRMGEGEGDSTDTDNDAPTDSLSAADESP